MSDQKKPPVPSFEELQAAQRAREAASKRPAPAAPAPGQLDPRLMKTAPAAPNPVLLNQSKTGATSRLDAEMLSRLATGGLSGGNYPKGNLEPTQLGPMPKPPSPDERTQIQRAPTVPPPPAPPPRAGIPAGQPSSLPPQRAPSIPHAPASLTSRPPAPQGPPPKMPAPPPPGAAPLARPPAAPPAPAATRQPTNPPPGYAPRAPAPPNPPATSTPASLRASGNTPIPGSTISMRQPTNVPPAPTYSPTLARHATGSGLPAPEGHPLGAEPGSGLSATLLRPVTGEKVAIEPEDASTATVQRKVPEPPAAATARVPVAAPRGAVSTSPQPPSEVSSNPTHKVNRAELQSLFADAPTAPRMPAAHPPAPAPVKTPQPKLAAARPELSSSKASMSEAVDDRTPVHSPRPVEQAPGQRPIASGFADESSVPMPHLDRPPALNSKSLLDVGPVDSAPDHESVPLNRSETVNLRPPSRDELTPVQQPRPVSSGKPLVEITPEERTPLKVSAAFATTQPGMPGPFARKSPRATDMAVTPVDADAQPGQELEPVTLSPAAGSSLGEAFDPSARSESVPALETQMRPVKGELVAAPASLLRRSISFLVDFALVGSLCAGLLYLASVVKGVKAVPAQLSDLDILLYRAHALDKLLIPSLLLCCLVVLVYSTVFASALGGRTPGRWVTGVRLVTAGGEPPGLVRALLRAVFSFVSFGLCLSGFWLALFDRKGQTLHDKLTRTFVVRPL